MSIGISRFSRRTNAWFVVVLVVLLAGAVPVVSAHANLVESSPANGERVPTAPDELVLTYSEGIQIATVSVESADGTTVSGPAQVDSRRQTVVRVPLDELDDGTYVVTWEVLSVDGHTTRGSFFFGVGDETPTREQLLAAYAADDPSGPSVSPLEPVLRTALLLGLAVLVGVPITLFLVVDPLVREHGLDSSSLDRTVRLLVGGALLAVTLAVAGLALVRLWTAGPPSLARLERYATTQLGRAMLVQLGGVAVLATVGLLRARRGVRFRRTSLGVAGLVGLLLAATVAWTGHSAATADTAGALVELGHLLGASIWVGGLVALAVVVPDLLRRSPDGTRTAMQVIRRFSVVAVFGVTVAGATGLAVAAWHVPLPSSLAETTYGTALSVKVVVVLAALLFAALNRFVLYRRLRAAEGRTDRRTLRTPLSILPLGGARSPTAAFVRSVRIELLLVVGVLLLSGFLTSVPTAADAGHHDVSDATAYPSFESEANGATISVRAVPGEVGPNVFDVRLTRDGTALRTDEPVTLLLRHPGRDVTLPQVELERLDDGTYSTVATLPNGGTWEVRVSAWVDGSYLAERYTVTVPSAEGAHGDHSGQGTYGEYVRGRLFDRYLRIGAVLVGLVGILVAGYEVRRLRR